MSTAFARIARAAGSAQRLARRLTGAAVGAHGDVEICDTGSANGCALVVARAFRANESVHAFRARVGADKSKYSVQVGRDAHTTGEDGGAYIYMNHSCTPSCRLELLSATDGAGAAPREVEVGIVAARDLQPGEAVTFDYNTTEWRMAEPFTCGCATARPCVVGGASAMGADERARWLRESGGRHAWVHVVQLLAEAREREAQER